MCILIDINNLSRVFNKDDSQHSKFRPILDWILKRGGKIVLGGTKYKNELAKSPRYLKHIEELRRINKVKDASCKDVNDRQSKIDKISPNSFNDTHILAIVIETKCDLVCTSDTTSIKYIKDRKYYPKHTMTPKFYTKLSNRNLLR